MKRGTRKDLRRLADIALRIARADLERDGSITPLIVIRKANGDITDLKYPKWAAELMNSGDAKDAIFGFVRELVRREGLTAVIFATDAWQGIATQKGMKLPTAELMERCHERGFETAVRDGLMIRTEVIQVNAQTPDGVLLVSQRYRRDLQRRCISRYWDPVEHCMGVDEFQGRQKMYGDLREANLR